MTLTQKKSPMSNDKRTALRTRCLREAHCVFNKGNSDLNVLIRNISSTGAKLCGDELLYLPEEFELQIHDGFGAFTSRWVKRVWSRPDSIGVTFIDPPRESSAASGAPESRNAPSARLPRRDGTA